MAGTKRKIQSPSEPSRLKRQRFEKKKITPQYIGPAERKIKEDLFIKELCDRFNQPQDAIAWILSNAKMSVDEFVESIWEKTHLYIPAADRSSSNEQLEKLFSCSFLEKVFDIQSKQNRTKGLSNSHINLRIAKFTEGKYIETEEPVSSGVSSNLQTKSSIERYLKDGYTIQVLEPETVQPALHALVEPLETFFGSLVSVNGYITPANCQMRPPCYDNESYFVIQTVGRQVWKLFKTVQELATNFSRELNENEIGEAINVVTLEPGDVLYLPRGTTFETVAHSESTSAYLTLSTFCQHHFGSFVSKTVVGVFRQMHQQSADLRRGFPLGFLTSKKMRMNEACADALVQFAKEIRSTGRLRPDDVQEAMDSLVGQFMCRRLPPFNLKLYNSVISADSKVRLRYKHHLAYYLRRSDTFMADEAGEELEENLDVLSKHKNSEKTQKQQTAEEDHLGIEEKTNNGEGDAARERLTDNAEEEEEDEFYELAVLCSVQNDPRLRNDTWLAESNDNAVAFRSCYKPLLDGLFKSNGPIEVSDLMKEIGTRGDAVMFVQALSNMGIIEIVENSY